MIVVSDVAMLNVIDVEVRRPCLTCLTDMVEAGCPLTDWMSPSAHMASLYPLVVEEEEIP
jgi:hypothetical protein